MLPRRLAVLAPLAAAALLALTGCATAVTLGAGPHATAVGCAKVIVSLPTEIGGQQQRDTDAQGTSAWGDPSTVLLRCGVTPIGATPQPCITVNGIDWVLLTDPAAKSIRYITFGRSPATEIIIDHAKVSDTAVLPALADAIGNVPQTRKCLSNLDDTTPSATPAPNSGATSTPTPSATPAG